MQIAEGNLPPIASPFGRLGPLATQMSTGHLRFTLVHFRVRIASAEIHVSEKATPEGVAFLIMHQRRFEHPTHGAIWRFFGECEHFNLSADYR